MDSSDFSVTTATYLIEQAVIGGCLLEPRRAIEASALISEFSFEDPRWGLAFGHIARAAHSGRVIDGVILADEMYQRWGTRSTDDGIGVRNRTYWRNVYSMLAEAVVSGVPALVDQYAQKVRLAWLKRQIVYLLDRVQDELYADISAEVILVGVASDIESIGKRYASPGLQ